MNEQSYKNTLHNYEPAFNSAHWEAMQAKMENAKPPVKRLVWYKSMHWAAVWLVFAFVGSGSSAWFTLNKLEEAHITVPSQQDGLLGLSEEKEKKNAESNFENNAPKNLNQANQNNGTKAWATSKKVANSNSNIKTTEIASLTANWETSKTENLRSGLEITLKRKDNLIDWEMPTYQTEMPETTNSDVFSNKKPLKKSTWSVSISGGTGNYSKIAEENFTSPLLAASMNYAVSDRVQASVFTGTRSSETQLPHGTFSKSELILGADVKYHIPISHKTSIYVGGGVAHKSVKEKKNTLTASALSSSISIRENSLQKEHDLKDSDWIGFATAGIQHKFSQTVSAFVETSQGLANIRGGLQVNLY